MSRRTLLWTGLALLAAAVLLDDLVVVRWFAAAGLRESRGLSAAVLLLRIGLFQGGIAVLLLRARRAVGAPPAAREGRLVRLMLLTSLLYPALIGAQQLFAAARGAAAIAAAGLVLALLLLLLHGVAVLLLGAFHREGLVPGPARPLLLLGSLTALAVVLELALGALASRPARGADPGEAPRVVMPDALARREVEVPGARHAWYWQGKLHVFDAEGFRRTEPFPPRRAEACRVLALGDSLTYGHGVAADEAWPAVLERGLDGEYRVEVLNLGVGGAQSEDILHRLERLLPRLEPDLVLYGVCLNDFLPAQRGEYRRNDAWSVGFPGSRHLELDTRLGALVAARYGDLLVRAGVRADFFADILRDFRDYRTRFARDVAAMNRLVTARGLPPVVAMVLNQFPDTKGRGHRIGTYAEQYLREAGMRVVPADYLAANDGRTDLVVSRWEAHPSAEAHLIFAAQFLKALRGDPRLERCRR